MSRRRSSCRSPPKSSGEISSGEDGSGEDGSGDESSGEEKDPWKGWIRVPVSNLLGKEGQGMGIAVHNLAEERLSIAVHAIGMCKGILDTTIAYTKDRTVFGKPVADFQNTRFKIAEMVAQTQAMQVGASSVTSQPAPTPTMKRR